MKKAFVFFLLAILAGGNVFAGGASQNTGAKPAPVVTASSEKGYTLPLTTSGETLRIATTELGLGVNLRDGVPVFNSIEKDTGVKISWETSPDADYNNAMQIRLAAGSDLPDIARIPGNQMTYIRQLTPLNALIDQYAAGLQTWMTNEPDLRKLITAPDGQIYTLPIQIYQNQGEADMNPFCFTVRKDWLAKLGLPEPTTLNEFHDLLLKLKNFDPFGDGKTKVIPFSPAISKVQVVAGVGWAYGLHLQAGQGFSPDKNGKIVYEWIEPRFREVLQVMNQWWNEGLVDPSFMNFNNQQWTAQLINCQIGTSTMRVFQAENNFNRRIREAAKDPNACFWPLKPLTGPYGDCISETDAGTMNTGTGATFGIMTSSARKELAMKWLDYVAYSKAGVMYDDYGVEGLSYNIVNGQVQWTDAFLNSTDGLTGALRKIGAVRGNLPMAYTNQGFEMRRLIWDNEELYARGREIFGKRDPVMLFAIPSLDETDVMNNYTTDIESYRDEMVIKFVTGAEPLSKWDEYVNTIKKLNIDAILKVKQAQYDRLK